MGMLLENGDVEMKSNYLLKDRQGRAKYCSGYESFPRKFKKLIQELNTLFDSEIDF